MKYKVIKLEWDTTKAAYTYELRAWVAPEIKAYYGIGGPPDEDFVKLACGDKEWAEKTIKHYKLKAVSK